MGKFKSTMSVGQASLGMPSGVRLMWVGYAIAASRYHQI